MSKTAISELDVVVTDPVSGRDTGLAKTIRRAIKALSASGIPYCIIGAAALAARGLPRMTRDLDLIVLSDDGDAAIATLRKAGFRAVAPPSYADQSDPMIVLVDPTNGVEVDVLIAAGNPEALIISTAPRAKIFGAMAPVATLEQLLLLYLYSNQPRHLGDFASIVQFPGVNLAEATRMLAEIHPEMLKLFRKRVKACQNIPAAPRKPRINGR